MGKYVDLGHRRDFASPTRRHASFRGRLRLLEYRLHTSERHSSELAEDHHFPVPGSAVDPLGSTFSKPLPVVPRSCTRIKWCLDVWQEDLDGLSRSFSDWITRLDDQQRIAAGMGQPDPRLDVLLVRTIA